MRYRMLIAGSLLAVGAMLAAALPQGQSAAPGQGQSKKDDKQQKKSDKTSAEQKKKDDDDLSTGTIQASASKKSANTATLGFKGVGPDGEIDEAKLKEDPTSDDRNLVNQIKQIAVANDDLKEFEKDGNLKSR